MNVIDLFAGCGGLSLGFEKAGFTLAKAVEYDPVIANTYQKNHPNVEVIVDDIKNIDNSGVFHPGDAEIIIGGPPARVSLWPAHASAVISLTTPGITCLSTILMW